MNPSWLVRWIVPLMIASVFLTAIYYAIPSLQLENFWYHFVGACAIAVGFFLYWIMHIKGPNLGISFIDEWVNKWGADNGQNADITQYIKDNAFVIYYSKSKNLRGAISLAVIGVFILYTLGYQQKSYFWGIFMGCFFLNLALRFSRDLRDRSPKLVLRADGLVTPKLGFVSWESVNLIQLRDSSSGESISTHLDIYVNQTKSPDDSFCADFFNVSLEKLETAIEHLAKRQLPRV